MTSAKSALIPLMLLHLELPAQTEGNGACFDSSYKEGAALVIRAGDYKAIFAERPSWTLRELSYKGKDTLVPSGWMQSVLRETVPVESMASSARGTALKARYP